MGGGVQTRPLPYAKCAIHKNSVPLSKYLNLLPEGEKCVEKLHITTKLYKKATWSIGWL